MGRAADHWRLWQGMDKHCIARARTVFHQARFPSAEIVYCYEVMRAWGFYRLANQATVPPWEIHPKIKAYLENWGPWARKQAAAQEEPI